MQLVKTTNENIISIVTASSLINFDLDKKRFTQYNVQLSGTIAAATAFDDSICIATTQR